MNEDDKHEQEQSITKWPFYAHLVLAFSILFAIVVVVVGFLQLWVEIDTSTLSHNWSQMHSHWQVATLVALCLALAFFAGAFVFLAFKTMTEKSEAAGKAVVWVCRILFYPIHVVVRAFICLVAVLLLLAAIVVAVLLGYCSYTWLGPRLDMLDYSSLNTLLGAGLASALVIALPKFIMPTFSKCLERMEEIIEAVSNLSLFPKMAIRESWKTTKEATEAVDKKITELVFKLALLVILAPIAGASITAFNAASPSKEEAPTPPAQKSSYVFLGNMPWIVGNVQSFFSSAVVFPKDAKPADLGNGNMEGALSLNVTDQRFYQAVYKPLLADLARCGTSDNKVKIELSGFSSSAKIENCDHWNTIKNACAVSGSEQTCKIQGYDKQPSINEVFNLCVAERRAESVRVMLESFLDNTEQEHVFDFTVKKWDSLGQMQDQTNKIFCDVTVQSGKNNGQDDKESCPGNGQYDATKGMMNRRVDVAITETPLCMM